MLPLKLLRSLDAINLPFHHKFDQNNTTTTTTISIPLILFVPTKELVKDSYKLARLARDIGMDLFPNPSLSHIIFSWPPNSQQQKDDAVPLPFPSLSTASLSHLRLFSNLSKGFFKLVFLKTKHNPFRYSCNNNWDVTNLGLVCCKTGVRIDSMDGFSMALLGLGWTLFKTNKDSAVVYLYRKVDLNRGCANEKGGNSSRVRELRLPQLDFKNAPLRILHYILLMTDDIFYLA